MTTDRRPDSDPNSVYRGALVYRPEDGYTQVTMTVSVFSGETSNVTSHAYTLPVSEEPEHLQRVDLYHFAASYGTRIQLIITSLGGEEVVPQGRRGPDWDIYPAAEQLDRFFPPVRVLLILDNIDQLGDQAPRNQYHSVSSAAHWHFFALSAAANRRFWQRRF